MKFYMINKDSFKRIIIPGITIILIVILGFLGISTIQYRNYEKIVNETISSMVDEIMKEYPNINEEEIVKLLQNVDLKSNNQTIKILEKYGYNEEITYIQKLENTKKVSVKMDIAIIFAFGLAIIIIILICNKKQNKKIEEINKYLKALNNKNYELKIEDNGEDELSKLRNELYKTTILLKEAAENSEIEKVNLSNSLADISHQIKTPLTSIRIMLDNIEENPDMDKQTKAEFIQEISKQIEWISSLVISLLKLAKFDAGSIIMNDTNINVKQLMNDVIRNLSIMLELKNIKIEEKIDDNVILKADYKWQLEAITNIVKNAIEHSKEGSCIHIEVENNSIFVKIKIRDEGEGIQIEDLKHIFERFYKAKKSSENSIGIGLALAKTIIEKENGYIKVESIVGEGTEFEIKYLKQ